MEKKLPEVIIKLEELQRYRKSGFMTVGELKERIKDIPDDGLVLIQRVEDLYYEENGWGVVLKEGEHYHYSKQWNQDLKSGKYEDEENYPNANPKLWEPIPDEDLELAKEQYHPAWSVVRYKDDLNNLYIDLHY
jgi:hypothetical protein